MSILFYFLIWLLRTAAKSSAMAHEEYCPRIVQFLCTAVHVILSPSASSYFIFIFFIIQYYSVICRLSDHAHCGEAPGRDSNPGRAIKRQRL